MRIDIFELPKYQEFAALTGIRQKWHKRMPYWGSVAPGVHVITGLYKNAFTFAYQAAKDISREIHNK